METVKNLKELRETILNKIDCPIRVSDECIKLKITDDADFFNEENKHLYPLMKHYDYNLLYVSVHKNVQKVVLSTIDDKVVGDYTIENFKEDNNILYDFYNVCTGYTLSISNSLEDKAERFIQYVLLDRKYQRKNQLYTTEDVIKSVSNMYNTGYKELIKILRGIKEYAYAFVKLDKQMERARKKRDKLINLSTS